MTLKIRTVDIVDRVPRNCDFVDINRQICSEKQIFGAELDVTKHGHVETGNCRDCALCLDKIST